MTVLTFDMAVAGARAAIAEHGEDFTYHAPVLGSSAPCYYVPTTDPRCPMRGAEPSENQARSGCIVGEILRHHGLLTDDVAESEHSVRVLVNLGLVVADDRTTGFLGVLQVGQDGGRPWGEALAEALADVEVAA